MNVNSEMLMQQPSRLIGNRIRSIRKSKGLTGSDLGKLLNLSQQHISRIENGSVKLNIEQLQRITDVLVVPLYNILLDVGYQPKILQPPLTCKTILQASSLII